MRRKMRRLDDDDLLEVLGTSGHKVQSQIKELLEVRLKSIGHTL